jgi:hypothetical protein
MKKFPTDHRAEHRHYGTCCGQHMTMDAMSNKNGVKSREGNLYVEIIVDLVSRDIHVIFTKDRSSDKLIKKLEAFFIHRYRS